MASQEKQRILDDFPLSPPFFSPNQNSANRGLPLPLGRGIWKRPNPKKKMGAPDPENPLFLGFSVLKGGLRPWSQTMILEGARPLGRGRSGDCEKCNFYVFVVVSPVRKQVCNVTARVLSCWNSQTDRGHAMTARHYHRNGHGCYSNFFEIKSASASVM